ncbi:PqqD family protein [Segatella albensis]|jgi:hypothetical protein|uniref:PqqD family protein n=1 Tax=Segatella albensis TaxID=77768 RepID=UPI00040B4D7C|nr:PqqD family protein [Segatella albensis]
MKAKEGFNIRVICGVNMIVAEGKENIDFNNIISMNESSAYLWRKVQKMEQFTTDDIAQLLIDEYEVDFNTAKADAQVIADQWIKAGIVEK